MKKSKIAVAIILSLSVLAYQAAANSAIALEGLEKVEVRGTVLKTDSGVMPLLQGGKLFEGKKTSVVDLSEQPAFVEPNLRQMFSRVPGLFVSEQQIPSIYNVNYRGLGDPHESEFIAFFQNNIPLAANMFGYPTMYYMPGAQRIERIEFVRGGAGLLYGPQIGPVVNFVTRGPDARSDTVLRTEHATGSNGLYSTYNEARWAQGDTGFMASFDHRRADGPRQNEDYDVSAIYLGLSYEGFKDIKLGVNLDRYNSDSGEAGRLTSAEFATNRDRVKSPFNRVEIEQTMANISYEQQLSDTANLHGKIWYSSMDRLSRRSAMFTDAANEPATTDIDEQQFANVGVDLRYSLIWGDNHIFTAGTTAYQGDSPRTRHVSNDIRSSEQLAEDLRFEQDRVMRYNAFFIENLFRFGQFSISPTLRVERINYDLTELLKQQNLNRDAIDLDRTDNELLLGLGSRYQLNDYAELYANISESYRPQRFDDLVNPSSELAGSNGPKASRAINYELGYRSQLTANMLLDISLFRIDFNDKIEQIQLTVADVERVNSGDSRHQGIEFTIEYDVLTAAAHSLTWFANGSLLDAEITQSVTSSLVGNDTAFSPDHVLRTGLLFNNDSLSMTLSATLVGAQYWQDSNVARGSGIAEIAAKIPSYQVLDLSAEYQLSPQWALYAGINNLLNENYYSRVRSDGIEPAAERSGYIGVRFQL
ncbi:TonB-dependent receptor [Arsukibacterium sp. MJ3]|uniref:TonB-dependent receptor family protein n=1 Tax=Arsukibacterium sp. MJ3 TaxID=1632859 RepID=UPI00062745D8|nr:TonB-dependent receptor [Arsukibacterium sp. MJ3]KKO50295.1 TonB-dependent receptor [Arsukibacterium sp. MJ3]